MSQIFKGLHYHYIVPVKNDQLVFGYKTDVTKYSIVGSEWCKTHLPGHSRFWARDFTIYNYLDKTILLIKPGKKICSAYDLDCAEECNEPQIMPTTTQPHPGKVNERILPYPPFRH